MNRRSFIALSTTGIAALGISATFYGCGNPNYEIDQITETEQLSTIWDNLIKAEIGSLYRAHHEKENSEKKLVKLILEGHAC